MATEKIERLYTVPLGKAYEYTRTKRTRRSVSLLRQFLVKHMKSYDVRISEALNEFLWSRSMQKPPRKVKIKVVKEGEVVRASLPDEKPKPARKKKAPKEAPKTEEKKDAPKAEAKKEAVKPAKTGEKK
jgi:large subunit ribosomal protein L31e